MATEFSEYKGNKMIKLLSDEGETRWPFQFGKTKAKLIVENFEAIKAFAEEEVEEKPAEDAE